MNKRKVLIVVSFLSGILIAIVPLAIRLSLLAGVVVWLVMEYDEWEYNRRVGGAE